MSDLINREEVKRTIKRMESLPWSDEKGNRVEFVWTSELVELLIDKAPSAEPKTCEGCKHLGKWEDEITYGYPSPCTTCKRIVKDNYER